MKRMWSRNEIKKQVQEAASSGELQDVKIFEDIVDKDGHKRFVDGDVSLSERFTEGIEKVYGKWSLSGTHLMIVLAVNITGGTAITFGDLGSVVDMPQWVKDKIIPSISNYVEVKTAVSLKSDLSSGGNISYYLRKQGDNVFMSIASITPTADVYARFTFDLLIDSN